MSLNTGVLNRPTLFRQFGLIGESQHVVPLDVIIYWNRTSCRRFYAATLFRPVCVYVLANNAKLIHKNIHTKVYDLMIIPFPEI